jgi:hypothetical protein
VLADGTFFRVSAGVTWSELAPHVAAHGLAGVSGSWTDVGIVGYHHRRRRRPDDPHPRHPHRQGARDRARHRRRAVPAGRLGGAYALDGPHPDAFSHRSAAYSRAGRRTATLARITDVAGTYALYGVLQAGRYTRP